ncbi:hypothetical protein HK096_002976, partial [Nowakowskiella sp. JEL0078]
MIASHLPNVIRRPIASHPLSPAADPPSDVFSCRPSNDSCSSLYNPPRAPMFTSASNASSATLDFAHTMFSSMPRNTSLKLTQDSKIYHFAHALDTVHLPDSLSDPDHISPQFWEWIYNENFVDQAASINCVSENTKFADSKYQVIRIPERLLEISKGAKRGFIKPHMMDVFKLSADGFNA